MQKIKFYGIRNKKTKQALGFCYSSNNGADFCNDISFELEGFNYPTNNVWLTINKENAKKVFEVETGWYNADYENPQVPKGKFSILKKEYEVFEVEI